MVLKWQWFCLSRDVWQCLEALSFVTAVRGYVTSIWWVEASDAVIQPIMHRTAPVTESDFTQNVKSGEADAPSLPPAPYGRD